MSKFWLKKESHAIVCYPYTLSKHAVRHISVDYQHMFKRRCYMQTLRNHPKIYLDSNCPEMDMHYEPQQQQFRCDYATMCFYASNIIILSFWTTEGLLFCLAVC